MAKPEAHSDTIEGIPGIAPGTLGPVRSTVASGVRLGICLVPGRTVALAMTLVGSVVLTPLLGWDAAAALLISGLTVVVSRADQPTTTGLAVAEDAGNPIADLVLLSAAVTNLISVAVLLTQGATTGRPGPTGAIIVSLATVVLSWAVVHLIFTTRYARLHDTGQPGEISFNQPEPPRYLARAYLAFTARMTNQVWDTDLPDSQIRATAVPHGLLSCLFGAVILATTLNLVAGLAT